MNATIDQLDPDEPVSVHAPDGVYVPQRDTALLCEAAEAHLAGRAVTAALDLCTGSGAVALRMSGLAASVVAADIDPLAVAAARTNATRSGLDVEVVHGDLFEPVAHRRFDLITCNPPYLPAPPGACCARWDGGPDGRAVVDRVCREAGRRLVSGGTLLLVQSDLTGIELTLDLLRYRSFDVRIVAEHVGPLGPVAARRRAYLEALLGTGDVERLVVIEAVRSA